MPTKVAYSPVVAKRTRAATEMRNNATLLPIILECGGTKEELDEIILHGNRAGALNGTQTSVKAGGKAATEAVSIQFATTQEEYTSLMAVTEAIKGKWQRANLDKETLAQVVAILKNETPVTIKTIEKDGELKTRAVRKYTYEGVRGEIEKDVKGLLALQPVHAELAARGWPQERLEKLHAAAQGLSGKLSDRAVKTSAGKDVTAEEYAAVAAQSAVWSSLYRVLRKAAGKSVAIRDLLKDAKR